ncbi:LPD7 domain-containing protein [Salmonella enterica]|uniref:LPD7 domain-containing protein n=1 Tax=Salmonella enterica TaxID=28901 RepID=UPI001C448237|nr:LPD7 domain-containing protein [Salmonella enterica]
MKARYRTWLAVPPDERELARNAHPPVNGQKAVAWNNEHKLWYAQPGVELSLLDKWLPRPQNFSTNDSDPVIEFAQELEKAGLIIKGLPVMDGALHRVPTKADKKGVKSGVYKAFLDGQPAGWYRDYRSGDTEVTRWVFSGGDKIDPLARLHLKAQAQQNREDSARAQAQQYNRQAGYASRYVSRLPQATTSPYLTRKGVTAAPGVRINPGGELVIPFSNAQGKIRTYQRIPETGGKDARLLKDAEKTGNWFALGSPVNGQPLLFAEGYATAASLHESTGLPVLMCIDAGNLIAVGQNARAVWPDSPFIFCADNDHHLQNPQTGEPENKGVLSAIKAAELSGGKVIIPAFTEDEKAQKLTDFNDLDTARGRDTFRRVINVQLRELGVRTDFQDTYDVREAFTVGPLTFTPVQSEEQIMDNPTITEPETPAPALTEPTAVPQSPELQPEIQPTSGSDNTKPDNVAGEAPSDPAVTTATAENNQTFEHTQELPESGITEPVRSSGTSPLPDTGTSPAGQNEKEDSVSTTDKASQDTSVPTEPDKKTGAEPVSIFPQEEIVAHSPEDVLFQPESYPPESEAPDNYEDYRAYQEMMMTSESSEQQQEAGDFATQPDLPDTAGVQTEKPSDRNGPGHEPTSTPTNLTETQAPGIAPSFMGKARGFFSRRTVKAKANENNTSDISSESDVDSSTQEADTIVCGPRRPDAPVSLDMDEILKELKWETQPDKTVLYRLDDTPAFIDRGNRLEMVNGASENNRCVLAALAVATKFYGGVIELTGSDAFKKKAMQLIIDNNIGVRMKLPDQRAELEKLRQEVGTSHNTIVTHQPTPDLNQNTPAQPAMPEPTQENIQKTATEPQPTTSAVQPAPVSGSLTPPPAEPDQPDTQAPAEEPPGKLNPGEGVTAVLNNFGRAEYAPGKGESFFVELKNRSGSKIYWGQQLEDLVKQHQKGSVVTLTLQNREQFTLPGETRVRLRNNWRMESVNNGISVSHDNPESGQQIQAFPVETFRSVIEQMRQGWPEEMKELRVPENTESHLFLGPDRHPVSASLDSNRVTVTDGDAPEELIPVLGSVDKETRQLNLLLVQSAEDNLQGVVRLNGTLYPALATPSADNNQLVINALTDKGLRFAGYGEAVNHDADSTSRPAPELMQFHLKTRKEPLFAAVYNPDQQPNELYRNLGFEQSWQQWSDSQKPEGRQEKTLHQDLSHSPGR